MVLQKIQLLPNESKNSYYQVITKCNRSLLDWLSLQGTSDITKFDRMWLQSVSGITKWDVTTCIFSTE